MSGPILNQKLFNSIGHGFKAAARSAGHGVAAGTRSVYHGEAAARRTVRHVISGTTGDGEPMPTSALPLAQQMYQAAIAAGASKVNAAYLSGSAYEESNFNPAASKDDHGTSFGTMRVGKGIWKEFGKQGIQGNSLAQFSSYISKLKTRAPDTWAAMNAAGSPQEAHQALRANNDWKMGGPGNRFVYADQISKSAGANPTPPVTPGPPPPPAQHQPHQSPAQLAHQPPRAQPPQTLPPPPPVLTGQLPNYGEQPQPAVGPPPPPQYHGQAPGQVSTNDLQPVAYHPPPTSLPNPPPGHDFGLTPNALFPMEPAPSRASYSPGGIDNPGGGSFTYVPPLSQGSLANFPGQFGFNTSGNFGATDLPSYSPGNSFSPYVNAPTGNQPASNYGYNGYDPNAGNFFGSGQNQGPSFATGNFIPWNVAVNGPQQYSNNAASPVPLPPGMDPRNAPAMYWPSPFTNNIETANPSVGPEKADWPADVYTNTPLDNPYGPQPTENEQPTYTSTPGELLDDPTAPPPEAPATRKHQVAQAPVHFGGAPQNLGDRPPPPPQLSWGDITGFMADQSGGFFANSGGGAFSAGQLQGGGGFNPNRIGIQPGSLAAGGINPLTGMPLMSQDAQAGYNRAANTGGLYLGGIAGLWRGGGVHGTDPGHT